MNRALDLAAQQIGLNETDKKVALNEYLKNGGQNLDPAVTAWCAAFVNSTLQQSGMEGTGKLNARSFLDWGQGVDTPQEGDIAVFWRDNPESWKGHVGFFKGYDENGNVLVLGGNQGDSVSVSAYPKNQLLGFRRGENALADPMSGPPQSPNALTAMQEPQGPQISQNYLDPRAFMLPVQQRQRMRFT